jgi:uncharacterized membrane protein
LTQAKLFRASTANSPLTRRILAESAALVFRTDSRFSNPDRNTGVSARAAFHYNESGTLDLERRVFIRNR